MLNLKELTKSQDPSVSGVGRFLSKIDDPKNSNLKRPTVQELERLAADAHVGTGLEMHILPLVTLKPVFQHPDPKINAFLNHELERFGWGKLVREISTAYKFGFYAAEKVWEYRDTKIVLLDGEIFELRATVYKKLKSIHPVGVQLRMTEIGDPDGFDQVGGGIATVPEDKALIYTHQPEFGNRYGTALTTRAYKAWWTHELVTQFFNRYFENQSLPLPKIFYEPNPQPTDPNNPNSPVTDTAQQAAQGILEAVRAGSGVALPLYQDINSSEYKRSWDLEYVSTPDKSGEFLPYLESLDAKKLRSMLIPEKMVMAGGAGGAGSYAMVESLTDLFMMRLEGMASDLYGFLAINWARPLIDFNFGTDQPDATLNDPNLSKENKTFLRQLMTGVFGTLLADPRISPRVDLAGMAKELGIPTLEEAKDDVVQQDVSDDQSAKPLPEIKARGTRHDILELADDRPFGTRGATNNRTWEKQTKAFQESLGETYTTWAKTLESALLAATEADYDAVLKANLENLKTLLVRRYRSSIPAAQGLGLGDEVSPQSLEKLAKRLALLEEKIAVEIVPKVGTKIAADLADGIAVTNLTQLIGIRMGIVTRVAGGDYWANIISGWADARKERETRGEAGKIRWVLDNLATHCPDCPRFAGVYDSLDEIGAIPGDGQTQCGIYCRCWLEEQLPDGTWQRRISDL